MKLSEHVRYVGVNDFRPFLFENQWTLPHGVSYNSYLVVDEKIALVDTAAAAFGEQFLANIREEIGDRQVDYLIVNHMEPDHSALMSLVRKEYPGIQIVTNAKAVPMIEGYHGITDNVKVIKEGEILSLGSVSLTFAMIPMVHWPETMVRILLRNRLFSPVTHSDVSVLSRAGSVTGSRNTGMKWSGIMPASSANMDSRSRQH